MFCVFLAPKHLCSNGLWKISVWFLGVHRDMFTLKTGSNTKPINKLHVIWVWQLDTKPSFLYLCRMDGMKAKIHMKDECHGVPDPATNFESAKPKSIAKSPKIPDLDVQMKDRKKHEDRMDRRFVGLDDWESNGYMK